MNLSSLVPSTNEQIQLRDLILQGKIAASNVDFSIGLVTAKNPTSKQLYWVGRMIQDAANNIPATSSYVQIQKPIDLTIKIDVSKIVAMFANARKHLKFPKVTLLMDVNDLKSGVRFSFDRKGRNLLWANEAVSYGVTFASINLDTGVVDLRRHGQNRKTEFMKLLEDFSKAPIQMAILHGKLTGNCCFCSLPLTDERSLQCGYGDTCARHYRLPWGKQNNMTAVGDWALNGNKPDLVRTCSAASKSHLDAYVQRRNCVAEICGGKKLDSLNLTETDLKQLLEDVEIDLSPENLTCDGELSGQALRDKKAFLDAVKNEINSLIV